MNGIMAMSLGKSTSVLLVYCHLSNALKCKALKYTELTNYEHSRKEHNNVIQQ